MYPRRKVMALLASTISIFSGCQAVGNQYVEGHNWDGEVLEIMFKEDHDTDGFIILHEHHSDPSSDAIVYGSTPDFAGPLRIPFLQEIPSRAEPYPTANFKLELYEGEFSAWDSPGPSFTIYEDQLGSYSFTVPEELRRPPYFDVDSSVDYSSPAELNRN